MLVIVHRAGDAGIRVNVGEVIRRFPSPLAHERAGQPEFHLGIDRSDVADVNRAGLAVIDVIEPDRRILPVGRKDGFQTERGADVLERPDLLNPDRIRPANAVDGLAVEVSAETEAHLLFVLLEQPVTATLGDAVAVKRAALLEVGSRIHLRQGGVCHQQLTPGSRVHCDGKLACHEPFPLVIAVGGEVVLAVGEVFHRQLAHCGNDSRRGRAGQRAGIEQRRQTTVAVEVQEQSVVRVGRGRPGRDGEHVVRNIERDGVAVGIGNAREPQTALRGVRAALAENQQAQEVGANVLGQILIALGNHAELLNAFVDGVQLVKAERNRIVFAAVTVEAQLINAVANHLRRERAWRSQARVGGELLPQTGVVWTRDVHLLMQQRRFRLERKHFRGVHAGVNILERLSILGDFLRPRVWARTEVAVKRTALAG